MTEQQKLFKVRDLRKKDQYKIDDLYLNGYARIFGPTTTAVYNSLSRHAKFYTQESFPSEKLIAEEHNITDRSVRKAIKNLKEANIIQVERKKYKGKWLNNVYFLIDKSEWKKPEEIINELQNQRKKTTYGSTIETRGKKEQKPEEKNDTTRGKKQPIKDTNSKDTHIKDNIATSNEVAKRKDQEIFDLIEKFKEINPSYERLFSNKTQRAAIQRLLDKFGEKKLEKLINTISITNQMKFAPIITTPLELESKLGRLLSFIKQQQQTNKGKEFIITF